MAEAKVRQRSGQVGGVRDRAAVFRRGWALPARLRYCWATDARAGPRCGSPLLFPCEDHASIPVIRWKTAPPGTSSGSERTLASRLYLFSGKSRASDEISYTTTAAKPKIMKKATSTVTATAVTLPIRQRQSARTAGDNRKLKSIASVIGTTTSRVK